MLKNEPYKEKIKEGHNLAILTLLAKIKAYSYFYNVDIFMFQIWLKNFHNFILFFPTFQQAVFKIFCQNQENQP